MRSATAISLLVFASGVLAHPGHGMADGHWHGFSPELILLMLLAAAWAATRK